jgi:pimeloyl-ACP methyl ester carboxylesterase
MRNAARFAAVALLLAAAALALFMLAARQGWMTSDDAIMQQRYRLPNSRFALIDGQSIHYVDEGKGPAILLVHGSFASLRMWDAWATALRSRYRVIRFDRPPMGLSGREHGGRYDAKREAAIIGKLAERLGVARFVLVATSSGGESAAAFAAAHPDLVTGVIFANIAAGPIAFHPTDYPLSFRAALWVDPWLGGWHLPGFWRGILRANYADPRKVTPALVREWTDLNNRAQFYQRAPRPAGTMPFAGTPTDLKAIRSPALLLWSDHDPEVPLEVDGRKALALLGSMDKQLAVIPRCGHMMPLECGPMSAAVARRFLDRITRRNEP